MQVEDIARISLAARRTAEDEGDFAVCHGLLREVVIDHQRVAASVAEVFADGGACKRGVILHCGGISCGGGHDYRVIHRSVLAQGLDDGSHRTALLSDCHINTVHGVALEEVLPLVDDRVYGDGGLACLAVADDQLALSAPDRDHSVDSLQSCLERLGDRLAENDARGLALQRHIRQLSFDRAQAVKGRAEGIDDAANEAFADSDGGDAARAVHNHSFLYGVRRPHQHCTHIVRLEVHHDRTDAAAVQQFARFGLVKAVNADHAVADLQHLADLLKLEIVFHLAELAQQYLGDFTGFDRICHKLHDSSVDLVELRTYALKTAADAGIDDMVVDVENESANQVRIHLHGDMRIISGLFADKFTQTLEKGFIRLHRDMQVSVAKPDGPAVLVREIAEDFLQHIDTVVVGEQPEEAVQRIFHPFGEGFVQKGYLLTG